MPCLLTLLALSAPRLVVACLWFLSNWFRGMFHTPLWPVIGFVFAPTTLLWYTAVQHWFGGQWTTVPVIGLVVAILVDLSPASHGRRRRQTE